MKKKSVWKKEEATARALEMDSYYHKTGFEGYKYERDKWLQIAEEAVKDELRQMQIKAALQRT